VDGSIATAVATETASILADDNTFTGLNSFTQDLGTTGINNTGNLVMDTEASEIRNSTTVYDSRLLYCE
jgi:hypothetical protein